MKTEQSASSDAVVPKRVVMLAYEGASSMDIIGPLDLLAGVQIALKSPDKLYEVELVSPYGGLINTKPGNIEMNTTAVADLIDGHIDILLIAGGETAFEIAKDPDICSLVENLALRSTYVASICTGVFLLAQAGLLKNRRATTHWAWSKKLSDDFPETLVDAEKIYVKDGNIFTSAGITSGMDLALALIQSDFGAETALTVAQFWVMVLKRSGGQSQFSSLLPVPQEISTPIDRVITWAQKNLTSDLSVDEMAKYIAMSPRNFSRRFTKEVGLTPAKYVETLRLYKAKSHLELSEKSLDEIARVTGFANADSLRRSFLRTFKVSPKYYRQRNG